MIVEKNGFRVFDDEFESVLINDYSLEEVCEHIRKVKKEGVSLMGRYTGENINFLEEFYWLKKISVNTGRVLKDISVFNKLPNLRSVHGDFALNIKLASPKLEYIGCTWSKKGIITEECKNLGNIMITGCKDYPTFIEQLSKLESLKKILFVRGNMEDFTCMKEMKCLERLDIAYFPRIKSFEGIGVLKKTLKSLFIETGKNITDYTPLSELENLEELVISNKSVIDDLSFLKPLKKLKSFRPICTKITATNIENMDHIPQLCFYRTGADKLSRG